jgi:2-C-methyl-D-erythritol 4-phosphate cytidylyltransferase
VASFSVIIPAAGKSSRFRDDHYKKPFVPLENRAIWLHSAEKFLNRDDVKQLILVIAAEDRPDFQDKFAANVAILGIELVEGGDSRGLSVRNAIERVREDVDFVVVHDAARPCLADVWIDRVFAAAVESGAATLGIEVTSTLKKVANGVIQETVSRESLWESQTPQVFRRQLLLDAFAAATAEQLGQATDEAQLVEWQGGEVTMVTGSPLNRKITTRADLVFAKQALKALPKPDLLGRQTHPFQDGDLWR